jgi:hypothetical protein
MMILLVSENLLRPVSIRFNANKIMEVCVQILIDMLI